MKLPWADYVTLHTTCVHEHRQIWQLHNTCWMSFLIITRLRDFYKSPLNNSGTFLLFTIHFLLFQFTLKVKWNGKIKGTMKNWSHCVLPSCPSPIFLSPFLFADSDFPLILFAHFLTQNLKRDWLSKVGLILWKAHIYPHFIESISKRSLTLNELEASKF